MKCLAEIGGYPKNSSGAQALGEGLKAERLVGSAGSAISDETSEKDVKGLPKETKRHFWTPPFANLRAYLWNKEARAR
jgi:hypothetical protein